MIENQDGACKQRRLGKRNSRRRHDPSQPEDLRVLFLAERTDREPSVLEKLDLSQEAVFPHLGKGHLAGKAFDRSQIRDQLLGLGVLGIGIRIAAHFRQSVDGMLRLAVVAESAVALMDLFELAESIGFVTRLPPHLLALNKKRIPMVQARVNGEQPSSRLWGS
jgi:hypothetical protein